MLLPLSIRWVKPNFHISLSHWRKTTVSLETRNLLFPEAVWTVSRGSHRHPWQSHSLLTVFLRLTCACYGAVRAPATSLQLSWIPAESSVQTCSSHPLQLYHLTAGQDSLQLLNMNKTRQKLMEALHSKQKNKSKDHFSLAAADKGLSFRKAIKGIFTTARRGPIINFVIHYFAVHCTL